MRITASIVTHRTPLDQLYKAVGCILRSDVEKIFIVDNSPSNELESQMAYMAEWLENPSDAARLEYRHVENRGFGAGHNIAMRQAVGLNPEGCHLVMNADVWWEGDVVGRMVKWLKDNPEVGLMAPKTVFPDGRLQANCRMLPTPADLFMKRFLPGWMTRKRMARYLLEDIDHSREFDCPYFTGCFMLFRNRALEKCGFFDERFFMYPEDIDITRRIHRSFRTVYWPEACIVHEHRAASRHDAGMLWIHMKNMVKYFNKWGWFCDKERREMNAQCLMRNA